MLRVGSSLAPRRALATPIGLGSSETVQICRAKINVRSGRKALSVVNKSIIEKLLVSEGKTYFFAEEKLVIKPTIEAGEELVKNGKVSIIKPDEIASKLNNWTLLDIRPDFEFDRASVVDSFHVSLFVHDNPFDDIKSAIYNYIHFANFAGGWYMGDKLTILNEDFVDEVLSLDSVNKNTPLLLACHDGKRSLFAVKLLQDAGFKRLAVLEGGFIKCEGAGLETVEEGTEVHRAGVGGISGMVLKLAGNDVYY